MHSHVTWLLPRLTHPCVAWLIHVCATWLIHMRYDSFICVKWLIQIWHDSFIWDMTWANERWHMLRDSYMCVRHDSFTHARQRESPDLFIRNITHSNETCHEHMRHDMSIWDMTHVTWLIHVCATWLIHVCATWLIHVCATWLIQMRLYTSTSDMTHAYDIRLMQDSKKDMTHSMCVWHDSLT